MGMDKTCYNPVEEAYRVLERVLNNYQHGTPDDYTAAIEEAIGFLGEALDE